MNAIFKFISTVYLNFSFKSARAIMFREHRTIDGVHVGGKIVDGQYVCDGVISMACGKSNIPGSLVWGAGRTDAVMVKQGRVLAREKNTVAYYGSRVGFSNGFYNL